MFTFFSIQELLFFRSLLGLPAVLLQYESISAHSRQWFAGAVRDGSPSTHGPLGIAVTAILLFKT